MDPKTKELVDAAEARAKAATHGPWINVQPRSQDGGIALAHAGPSWDSALERPFPTATSIRMAEKILPKLPGWAEHEANAAFIAHARSDVPALCAVVREQDVAEHQTAIETSSAFEHIGNIARDALGSDPGTGKPSRIRARDNVRALGERVREQDAARETERVAWREYADALHNVATTYEICGEEDMAEADGRLARAKSALIACGVPEAFIDTASTSP